MNEIEMALLRHEQRKEKKENPKRKKDEYKMSNLFSKILISIIFLLMSTIYIKLDPKNLAYFKKQLFESNLTFTKINNWYHDTFGNILPTVKEPNESLVSNTHTPFEKENYRDGVKINLASINPVETMTSGILVFMGEKEGYGNTLIIQGVDGVDIWYGGITDSNLKLYDYVEASTILGQSKENFYYLVFQKDGVFITYEEYMSKISS